MKHVHFVEGETGSRLKAERERNRLTVAQAALLSGVTADQWHALEEGHLCMSGDFIDSLQQLGFEPDFIKTGSRSYWRSSDERFIRRTQNPGIARDDPLLISSSRHAPDSESFCKAIELMRRSIAAVDAFVGEGAASKSPSLVVALMNATVQNKAQEDAQQVAVAITNAAAVLGDAIAGASELFKEVVDDAVEALSPPGGR